MHVTHPRILIATFVVFAATLGAREAHADKNEIRAVTFDDDGATTRVNVRGATTPTFTVYKLERPSRVVIDVPQARLGEALRGHEGAATFTPSTWAVSTIAAQQIDDGGQVVRVIVTLARPGRYDVKTDGNNVVVMVTARDPAPKLGVDPKQAEALAKAQAESANAKQAAANADQARARAEQASMAAQAEAERLRKAADAAQRAADEAKRSGSKNTAELEKANRAAQVARDEAAKAKAEAARAQATAEQAHRDALAEASKAKADAARAVAETSKVKAEAERTRAEAGESVAKARAEAEQAKRDAERARAEIAKSTDAAARTKAEADAAKADAARMKAEAQATRLELEAARREAAQRKAEADAARAARAQLEADAAKARDEANLAKQNMSRTARNEVEAAKAEAERAREEARLAKADAEAARTAAAADKQRAEAAKADAAKTLADAKAQLATLEKRTQSAQAMEDKARSAHAAAVAREESAREIVAKAAREREAAEQAAMKAAEARDRSSNQVASERAKLVAEAKAAEERLAKATRATQEAEARRTAAETAADSARKQLDTTRTTLASVEQQRGAAEQAAREAARLRGEAEAAVSDAKRRRSEAETAVSDAKRRRSEAEMAAEQASRRRNEAESAAEIAARRRSEAEAAAQTASAQRSAAEQQRTAAEQQRSAAEQQRMAAEQQRKAAEAAARDADKQRAIAEAAARDADKQRAISETAAKKAVASKHDAEQSLEELLSRRQAAERAAQDLEARSKAEAKAQAELAAAQARQVGEAELAKVRREAARLADERKRAEDELADRRKAVATQQAQAERLKTEAAQARDAAEREEQRRSQLAAQRISEEKELAKLQAQKSELAAQQRPGLKGPGDREAGSRGWAPEATKAAVAAKPAPAPAPVAVAPVVTAPATKAAFVKDITFTGSNAGGNVAIALTGEGKVTAGEVSATHAELIIDGAELASKLERKLDVRKFGGPVRAVSSFRDRRTPNRVRLVAELDAPASASFDRDATGIRWTFSGTTAPKTAKATRTQNLPPPVVGGFGAASTPITQQSVSQVPQAPRNRKVYRGAIVDLDYKDAPIHDLLRQLAMTGKVNIVVPEGVDAKVSVVLKKVPWDQALEVILASHGLWYRRDGNLFRVAPRKELDAEDEAEAARREALVKSEVPRPEVVPLAYSSAADLKPKLEAMLSPKGRIEVDDRTNALIINDVAGNREQISRLALQLDIQTPQISIEARIVEARSTFLRQIGIQWGGRASMSAAGGNATGLLFPSSIGIAGGNEDAQTVRGGVATPSDFAINLPAATGSGEGGAIGMSLGSVGGNFNINLRLSALEDTGSVRIISAPKITVLNNKEASISQGVSIPISVVSAAGTQTQFVQADLSLKVKPYVSQRDCQIAMDLNVTKNEPDFVNVGARGDPTILRKEAKTSMLVSDGETSVLGGIYTRNTGLAYKKVPFFGDLPVLGWFFKNRRENDDRTEILVFITPKITNKANLRCQ